MPYAVVVAPNGNMWLRCERPALDKQASSMCKERCDVDSAPVPCDGTWHKRTLGPMSLVNSRPTARKLRGLPTGGSTDREGSAGATQPCVPLAIETKRETIGDTVDDMYGMIQLQDPDLFYRMNRWSGAPDRGHPLFQPAWATEDEEELGEAIEAAEDSYAGDRGPGGGPSTMACEKSTAGRQCTLERAEGKDDPDDRGTRPWTRAPDGWSKYREATNGWIIEPCLEKPGTKWFRNPTQYAVCVRAMFRCRPKRPRYCSAFWNPASKAGGHDVDWGDCVLSSAHVGANQQAWVDVAMAINTVLGIGVEPHTCKDCGCSACATERGAAVETEWLLGVVGGGHEPAIGAFWQGALLYDRLGRASGGHAADLRRSLERALAGRA